MNEELSGLAPDDQERMRRVYQYYGIPYNLEKALEEVSQAERLGAYLDGERGRIGVTVKRLLENISLGVFVLGQGQVTRKSLQVLAGKEVHCLQFRRPLFSVYDRLWTLIAGEEDEPYLTVSVCEEILASLCLSPLRFTDWRAEVDPFVMASDASESGGGFVMARRLTALGVRAAQAPDSRLSWRSGIVVVDMFAGIGGLLRSLERAGVEWEHHIVVESDKSCRRCLRRTWPGGAEFTDIKALNKEALRHELLKLERVVLIIAGGGSPCQGLSKLSSGRKHFADERTGLFYDLVDRLQEIKELCVEFGAQFLGLVENVVMDETDRDEISLKLGWQPVLCESADISRVRRPRLYWLSAEVPDAPWLEVIRGSVACKIRMFGEMEPDGLWLPPGTSWPGGEGTDLRFPTFTRPIVRKRPPPQPAGYEHSSREALERWKEDKYRFPPYTYEEKFLLLGKDGARHKLPADSRELLMGYPKGHTKKLDRELFLKKSQSEAEDARQAAIGNSFHTGTVATLLGTILFHMGILPRAKGPDVLLQEFMMDNEAEGYFHSEDAASTSTRADRPLGHQEEEEQLMLLESDQPDLDEARSHQELMSRLVSHFLRKVEFRGSDIRLDADVIFRPSACPRCSIDPDKWEWRHCRAFKWAKSAHINLLELKSLLHAVQWRARRKRFHSFRTMILCDSQAVVTVVAKGRSSSRRVNHLLRRLAAHCCALNLYLLICWVDTSQNPADKASRLFDASTARTD